MRILIVNHFPLVGSGSGTYTENIAVHLSAMGHEVCVVLPENTKTYDTPPGVALHPVFFTYQEEIEGALPFNFPCFTSHPRSNVTFEDLDEGQLAAYVSAFEKAIAEAVESFKPDIIHAQHIWVLACLAARHEIPCVITAHGTDLMGYHKFPACCAFADEAAERAAGIITISADTDALVRKTFPEAAHKTRIMKNGYDPNFFYPDDTTREEVLAAYDILEDPTYFVFFAGKLTHFKGIDTLLKAARVYENAGLGTILTLIAGDGELSGPLRAQAKELGLRHVYFLGHVTRDPLRRLYSAADVAVVPSRREPFGLVAVEALACGTPVIATNQGGLPDFINSDVGALVDVDDSIALSSAILAELQNPDRPARGSYAAEYAREHYSQEQNTKALISYYQSALRETIIK